LFRAVPSSVVFNKLRKRCAEARQAMTIFPSETGRPCWWRFRRQRFYGLLALLLDLKWRGQLPWTCSHAT